MKQKHFELKEQNLGRDCPSGGPWVWVQHGVTPEIAPVLVVLIVNRPIQIG